MGAYPSYVEFIETDALQDRAARAARLLHSCALCGRRCGIDRTAGERGVCGTGPSAVVSSWGPHHGEEAPLRGRHGSGTVFFAACNMGCVFCQNWEISHSRAGLEVDAEALAGIFLDLQARGCHNLNLVSPTHVVPAILAGLAAAAPRGLRLPIVYNTGGYDSLETLSLLDGVVDIYMPDVKYGDSRPGRLFSGVADYVEVSRAALREMYRQVGDLELDATGLARHGLLVRHLVLPGDLAHTGAVLRFVAEEISRDTYLNLMDQYRPCYRAHEFPRLDRRLTPREFGSAVALARELGLRRLDGVARD
jgi:putative pyruvate formate lyase activating enzyme